MPWLVKGSEDPAKDLFFVHVPRCGGTSLTQHFDVPKKSRVGRSCWGKFGMMYFFYRYSLLETANFPVKTWENLIALCQLTLSVALFLLGTFLPAMSEIPILAYTLLCGSVCMFSMSTFVATAPFIGRLPWVRRAYLWVIHYPLLRFMESVEWCTGTNKKGYMMHLTLPKLLQYGYVTPESMDQACTMAIVRNPYSRMVSVFQYNRYGPAEQFPRFVKDWHKMMKHYQETGEMEEYYTPCHGIPMFEYTHGDGQQLVRSVVKQEELKLLHSKGETQKAIADGSSVGDLPDPVRNALLGMPHTNKRGGQKKWWDYYDQESLDLTYDMYKKDFHVFGYSPKLEQRPDLKSPEQLPDELQELELFLRDSRVGVPSLHSVSIHAARVARGPSLDSQRSRNVQPSHTFPRRREAGTFATLPTVTQEQSDQSVSGASASAHNSHGAVELPETKV